MLSESEFSVFGQKSASNNTPFGRILSEFVLQLSIAMSNGSRVSDNNLLGGLLSEYNCTSGCEHITRSDTNVLVCEPDVSDKSPLRTTVLESFEIPPLPVAFYKDLKFSVQKNH